MATPTPITSMEDKLSNLQLQQEIENRNQQIRDLSEKIETMKIRRQEDKERLKDYDKLKIQVGRTIYKRSQAYCVCLAGTINRVQTENYGGPKQFAT